MPIQRTRAVILAAAAVTGLLADQMFHAPVWGINFPLGAAMLAAAGLAMPPQEGRTPWPWLAACFFASMWALRDTEALLAVDLMATLALFSLPLLQERSVLLGSMGLSELLAFPLRSAWATTFGTLDFAKVLRAEVPPSPNTGIRFPALGAGMLLAAPLVVVFGALFASADPVFEAGVSSVFKGDLTPLVSHSFTIGVFTWASAGYLWMLAKPPRVTPEGYEVPTLGGIQVITPLAATVLMFALFVAVQAGTLFGGRAFIASATNLTFAEYARRGFFQLMFASCLVLPLLYVAPLVAGPLDERGTRLLRRLMSVQLALTALVLASALWRMGLYMSVYGLTEERIYVTAMIGWVGATLAVFAVTVLRGRPQGAAFGSLIAAVVTLATLNLANPSATIARYNLSHQNGREIDFEHLAGLGGDAVPVLAAQIDLVPDALRCDLVTSLRKRYLELPGDWRGWNFSRRRAHDAVKTLDLAAARCVVSRLGNML